MMTGDDERATTEDLVRRILAAGTPTPPVTVWRQWSSVTRGVTRRRRGGRARVIERPTYRDPLAWEDARLPGTEGPLEGWEQEARDRDQ